MLKKLLVGFCLLLMLVLPSTVVIATSTSDSINEIGLKNISFKSDLPDLIITDIFAVKVDTEDPWYYMDGLKITIKNIGNTTIPSNANSTVHYVVTKLFFGIFPIKVVDDVVRETSLHLHPGATKELWIISDEWKNYDDYGRIGIFKVHVTVNPEVEEENYDNNKYSEGFFGYKFMFVWWAWHGVS